MTVRLFKPFTTFALFIPLRPAGLPLLVTLFSALLLTGCQKDDAEIAPVIPVVKTLSLAHQTSNDSWHLSGTLVARYTTDMAFRVSGKIRQRLVEAGDSVQADQPLFRLDDTDFNLARDVSRANIHATESEIKLSESELSRLKILIKRDLTSQQAVDQAENKSAVLNAQLKSLRLQAKQTQNQLDYTSLNSPGLGKVLAINAEEGEVVTTGQVVARIALAGHREVTVQVPESRLENLPTRATVTLMDSNATYQATLRVVDVQADLLSRTWEARYTLQPTADNEEAMQVLDNLSLDNLNLGQTAKLSFANDSALIKVPITALYEAGDSPSVWVVNAGKVSRKTVSVNALSETSAWVTAVDGGFNDETRIVVLGVHLLSEGQQVRESAQ